MALWWIVNKTDGQMSVSVHEAESQIAARMRANLAGHTGTFSEAYQLDTKTAKKMPKDLVGRVLSQKEALRLLKKIS